MSQKLHNPKSHAPAVYITCWLLQVSIQLISPGAKILYGRLSQWASSSGIAYRSISQLAIEMGCSERSAEEYLRELKTVKLIGTYHPQAGGLNHYEFYDHPWMHEPIKEQLVYKEDKFTPPHHGVVPTTSTCGTPPHHSVDINNKEIKEIKCVGADATHPAISSLKKSKAEARALEDPTIREFFNTKFLGYAISLEDLFKSCQEHYEQKSLWATKDKFLQWIKTENIEKYKKTNTTLVDNETEEQRNERQYFQYELTKERERSGYISKALEQFPEMRKKYA
jgi:hypothetical protein